MKVSYDLDKSVKAKAEKLALVTLDIVGKHAGKSGVTYQGFLFTPEDVEKAWQFFQWLATRKAPQRKAKK